jgi:uncharacterized UPF0146 family protein
MVDKHPDVFTDARASIIGCLDGFDRVVEVGVGRRPEVARALVGRGLDVLATDVHDRDVGGDGVRFVRDDVTDPDRSLYVGAETIYALNCPPELQRPLVDVARSVGAVCSFTTLGSDPAVVPATPETLPGETLFHALGAAADAPAPLRGERP